MERIEELIICPVCLDRFEEPKMLPCQHTFCLRPCLENIVQNNRVCCPACRACHTLHDGVEGLPSNLTIVNLLDVPIQQKPHQQCKEFQMGVGANNKCDHCDERFDLGEVSNRTRSYRDQRDAQPSREATNPPPVENETDSNFLVTEALRRYRNKGQVKKCFGSKGNDVLRMILQVREGQMNYPRGISSTAADDIVVADTDNHRIQYSKSSFPTTRLCYNYCSIRVRILESLWPYLRLSYFKIFDENGFVKGAFGSEGISEGKLYWVHGVCVTSWGQITASDWGNHRIQIFDEHGRFVRTFGRKGSGNGEFHRPCGVATDDRGLIYVCDAGNHRVQVFSANGEFVRKFGSEGNRLDKPNYLSVTSNGRVVVGDAGNHRVQVFDSYDGRHLFELGTEGTNESQFKNPRGIATDHHGNIIVCDSGNNRVQVFASDGGFVSCFGTKGSNPGQMNGLQGVCLLSDGGIAVSDSGNHRVQVFLKNDIMGNRN